MRASVSEGSIPEIEARKTYARTTSDCGNRPQQAKMGAPFGLSQARRSSLLPSRPREFHPEPLTESGLDTLASSGSCHRSKAAAFRWSSGSSCCQLARPNVDDLPPSLQPHYRAFAATTRQSAPLRRIGTFGLAVGAACAFSLGIAGKVLTFRMKAWSSFAPPTRRMPLEPSQASPELIPEEGSPPGFDIA